MTDNNPVNLQATAARDVDPSSWNDSLLKSIKSSLKNDKYPSFSKKNQEVIKNILAKIPQLDDNVTKIFDINYNRKNASKSKQHREQGNKYYSLLKNENLNNAIDEYTKSVAYASPNDDELSLAYANRSAALFKSRLYSHCLNDIEQALSNHYPDNLKAKLYARKSICQKLSRSFDDDQGKKSFQQANKWLNKMDEKNKKFTEKLLQEYKTTTNEVHNREFGIWTTIKPVPTLKNKNKQLSELSGSVKLSYDDKFGWQLIATSDIEPDDVVYVHKPYAKIVLDSMKYKICSLCCKQIWSSVPCDDCPDAFYCSTTCKKIGQMEHHNYECRVIGPMMEFNMKDYFFMALRLAVKALDDADDSFELLKSNISELNNKQVKVNEKYTRGVIDPTKFSSIYNMNTNEMVVKINKPELLRGSILIAYLLVTKTEFIGRKLTGSIGDLKDDDDFVFMIEFIEKLASLSMTNMFTIDMRLDTEVMDDSIKRIDIGLGISVCQSLINHSCNPNVFCRYHDDHIIAHCLQPVKKGEQIFTCYGAHFNKLTKNERQVILYDGHQFKCRCEACNNNWPVKPIKSTASSFSCKHERQELNRIFKAFKHDMEMRTGFVTATAQMGVLTTVQHHEQGEIAEGVKILSNRFGKNSTEAYQFMKLLKRVFCFGDVPFYIVK
ncbi:hypothetical protein HCN44_006516 [Aphidius gifuensis]|uniref:SET domain-containing protein n=2 Tax=Aphidius gifuensis TaxID=684658 RepID=A0A834Y1K5_APHGI|nr:hypothetical protein HCN44_006516 [Aphidius gifuensis]